MLGGMFDGKFTQTTKCGIAKLLVISPYHDLAVATPQTFEDLHVLANWDIVHHRTLAWSSVKTYQALCFDEYPNLLEGNCTGEVPKIVVDGLRCNWELTTSRYSARSVMI
jgi:hypothetical protein